MADSRWSEVVVEQDALKRNMRQLQLKVERTLRCIGYELFRLGREAENLERLHPNNALYIAPNSPVWRLMGSEIPDLSNKLTSVTAEIEGIDRQQARARVQAWVMPLFDRLVQPGVRGLAGVELRLTKSDDPSMDRYGPEDN
jgi:hypothetical protein